MTKPSNLESIEHATGKKWSEWVAWLESFGADELPHPRIAEHVNEELQGKVENAGWWAQGITVAYEQHIGRRVPGQQNDGTFELTVTKTLAGTKEDVFALWNEAYGMAKEFNGQAVGAVRTSITPVRSYWRCSLAGGSALSVAVEQKGPARAMASITHTKLGSSEEKDKWRTYWKEIIAKL